MKKCSRSSSRTPLEEHGLPPKFDCTLPVTAGSWAGRVVFPTSVYSLVKIWLHADFGRQASLQNPEPQKPVLPK